MLIDSIKPTLVKQAVEQPRFGNIKKSRLCECRYESCNEGYL